MRDRTAQGRPRDPGRLLAPDDRGLAAIVAYGDIATPQGIKRGSSYAELHRVYPSWVGSGDHNDGHGLVAVPGNDDAYYRIDVVGGKVDSVTLQLRHQDCYD
ncbi:MAG: hypothetical protein HOV83_36555 [Catenulispora sp.]|nr:hypothetical protein [Catenulispora sp.]